MNASEPVIRLRDVDRSAKVAETLIVEQRGHLGSSWPETADTPGSRSKAGIGLGRISIVRNVVTPIRSGPASNQSVRAVKSKVGKGCLKKRRPASRKAPGKQRLYGCITGWIGR